MNSTVTTAATALLALLCITGVTPAENTQPTSAPASQPKTEPQPVDQPAEEKTPTTPANVSAQPVVQVQGVPFTPAVIQPDQHPQPQPMSTPTVLNTPSSSSALSPIAPATAAQAANQTTMERLRDPAWWQGQFGLRIVRTGDGEKAYLLAPGGLIAIPASTPPPGSAYQSRPSLVSERPASAAVLLSRTFKTNRQAFYPRLSSASRPATAKSNATAPRKIGTPPSLAPAVGSSFSPGNTLR